LPQAQTTLMVWYAGWVSGFMAGGFVLLTLR